MFHTLSVTVDGRMHARSKEHPEVGDAHGTTRFEGRMPASSKQNRRRTANPDLPRFVYPNLKRYRAMVRHGSEIFYVGTFGTPEEASEFAERLAKRLRGKSYTPVAKRKKAARPK
jgi:hypothetical protein